MSSYQHKSGAQKRKEREGKEKEKKRGQLLLGQFFTPSTSREQPSQELSSEDETSKEQECDSAEVMGSTQSLQSVQCSTEVSGVIASRKISTSPPPDQFPSVSVSCEYETRNFCDVGDPKFDIYIDLKYPHLPPPDQFPKDRTGYSITNSIFKKKLTNGEFVLRDWLVWSKIKEAFFCLPCKLFSKLPKGQISLFAADGYSTAQKWKKLYDRVPEHENSAVHRSCYIQWRAEVKKLQVGSSLSDLMLKSIQKEQETWTEILKRLLHVTLFLAERGLAFRGESNRIGDQSNGNFLGLLELIGNYDPLLGHHLKKIRQAQEEGRKCISYLSPDIQNELIEACAAEIIKIISQEREKAKYYAVIVDATPDSSHLEQTAILIRYLHSSSENNLGYVVKERLLAFADCSMKTGEAIARLIMDKLEEKKIPLKDCRGQGYDNGSNMKGAYKGVQAILLAENSLAVYSACACHSLNLCGEQAAESCTAAVTFFGSIQKIYNIFSSSPQRWEILKKHVPHSLHSMSQTRWSARVDSVKPISNHLPGVMQALNELLPLNLTAECRSDVLGLKKYLSTLNFLLIASVWTKILQAIDIVNKVIHQRGGSVDVAAKNLRGLLNELNVMRNTKWDGILSEVLLVAKNIGWSVILEEENKRGRKRKKLWDERSEEDLEAEGMETRHFATFKRDIFYVILDSIISDIKQRFEAMESLNELFSVLWMAHKRTDTEIQEQASRLVHRYSVDIQLDIVDELKSMKSIYKENLGEETLPLLKLLNALKVNNLEELFPNVLIALRIFMTIPSTVASAERSFSALKRIKNVLRSTMCQNRLSSLGVLAVETELTRNTNLDSVILNFARKKARKIGFDI